MLYKSIFFQTQIIIEDPGASEYKLESLEEYAVYDVVISAYNNVGQSNSTSILRARTYESGMEFLNFTFIDIVTSVFLAPTSPPGNLTAVAESSTEIRVSWLPLSRHESKGKIMGYKVWPV